MMACGTRSNAHATLNVRVPTALPQHMRAKIREIVGLETDADHRGQGHAKDLLERTCIAADLSDTWLMLQVDPLAEDKQRLLNLYLSNGFSPIQAAPVIMMIRPSAGAGL